MQTLDEACRNFVAAFEDENPPDPKDRANRYEQKIFGEGSVAGLGFISIDLVYRTEEHQVLRSKDWAAEREIRRSGNPAAELNAYFGDSHMARHVYDRDTGLVVVNNFDFPAAEVRPITDEDVAALESSISTAHVCDGEYMNRILTPLGVHRLVSNIAALTNLR